MKQPKLGIIVFARMSSQRLPGKVVMDFGGRPLLAHILLRAAALALPIVVATSNGKDDDVVAVLAENYGVPTFRGSLDDVLQRAVDCAEAHGFEAFARLCGDRPYFPQDQMRDALAKIAGSFADGVPADLISNLVSNSPPPGLTTEVVRVAALQRALSRGATPHNREHLTSHLYEHAAQFDIRAIESNFHVVDGYRFAVDTPVDLERLSVVASVLRDVHAPYEEVGRQLGSLMAPDSAGADR